MPQYIWIDLNTNRDIDVIRPFSQYEDKPTREEASKWTDEEWANAKWERRIGRVSITKNPYWGQKGSW